MSPHHFMAVNDPIAEDVWAYTDPGGQPRTCRIAVGRPQQDPEDPAGDWACPVFVEAYEKCITAMGVGPVDALLNAMIIVEGLRRKLGTITPRAERQADANTGQPTVS